MRAWHWIALGAMAFGIPALACGGRVINDASGTTGGGGNGSGGGVDSPSLSAAQGAHFGGFPCTAYTAAYESCPPSSAAGGCPYYVDRGPPGGGLERKDGQWVAPGCVVEIVPPTDYGGTTCDHVDCQCTSGGTWTAAPWVDASIGLTCDL